MSTAEMLSFYATRFSSVEINYTFRRTSSEKALANCGETTPRGFTFTIKAPRRITHNARLRDRQDLWNMCFRFARGKSITGWPWK